MELVGRFVSFLGILCTSLLLLGSCTDAQDSSPEVCPLLGSDIQSEFSRSSKERIFLNFGAPAQCNGTVTSWRYYSYNIYEDDDEDCEDTERYTSKFLVYRQTGDSTYEPVPGSTKSVTITLRCPRDGGFRSRVATLSQSEQFTIQQNDILAACLMDTGSTNPLRIVGEGSTQSGSGQVYHYDVSGYQSCTTSELQSIDTQNPDFTSRNGIYRLHLYAEVSSPIAQCSGGSNPPPFTPSVVSGTYLNTASPISCSDTITSWHYCYYPSAAADSQLTYTATVSVWRLNTVLNQYELLPGSDHTLELVQPVSTLPKIFCKTEVLEASEYVRVQIGDVIGVSLPTQNPLPILANGANGYSLMRHNTLNASSTIQSAALSEVSSMALHLYPTIEFVPLPTTESPTTFEAPTTISPTTEAPTTIPPTTAAPTTLPPTTELPTTLPPTTEAPTTISPTTELPTTILPTTEAPTTLPPTTEATTTITTTIEGTESPITTEAETTTKSEAMTTLRPLTTQETTTVQSTDSTTTQPETTEQTNLPSGTTLNTNFPTDTTDLERSTTAGEQGTSESSTSEEEETTTGSSLSNSSQGVNAGDFAAIALGIVILIAIISAVAGVIVYKMKLCGGARKKGFARYSVTSDEVNVNTSRHDTLLRYSSIHGRPLELATIGHGVVHNIAPLYEKVDEDQFEGAPYEEPVVYINSDAQVQFSASGGGTAEYSFVLEQVIEGKKLEGEEDPYYLPANVESEIYAQLHQQGIRMIRDKDIETTTELGQGQFGMVRKGIWRNQLGFIIEVAVKTIKPTSDVEDKIKFLQEAAIMAQFKHPNVITLYGVVSTRGTTMIVVELLPKGDLKQYLDSMKPDPGELLPSFTPRSLLAFSQQIALGMHYLSSKGFVHRDLAARNILLSEGCICKIADFGMSRDLADEDYYVSHGGKVPIKWTAPEALHYRKYSTASDVWSYGCVLYEIWSLGQKPFGAMQNPEVVAKVDSGYRLPPPPGCPKAIYKYMIDCWNPIAVRRPGFRNILLSLLEDEEEILRMPRDAVGSNSLAAVLGASLDAGFNLYTELQTKYSNAMHTSL